MPAWFYFAAEIDLLSKLDSIALVNPEVSSRYEHTIPDNSILSSSTWRGVVLEGSRFFRPFRFVRLV
jgi:hypothetical protein